MTNMFSAPNKPSLKRRFFEEPIENKLINELEKTNKKKKRSPVAVDELYDCVSPISFLNENKSNDPPMFNEENSYTSEDLEDGFELNASSSNSLEVICPLAIHNAGFFDNGGNMGSLPCSSFVHNQVCHYIGLLEQKNMFLHSDIYQEVRTFLNAIQQNLFLESDDFILMEFFNCVRVFFETYIDNLGTNICAREFQYEGFYYDLQRLQQKLNESVEIGYPLEEKDFFVSTFR